MAEYMLVPSAKRSRFSSRQHALRHIDEHPQIHATEFPLRHTVDVYNKLRAGQIKDARYRSRRVLELAGDAAYPLTHPTVAESVTLLLAGPRKRHVKRPPYIYERQAPNRHHEQPNEADKEEREIDQILADSFPASDSPPWTFGVAETLPRTPNTKRSKLLIG